MGHTRPNLECGPSSRRSSSVHVKKWFVRATSRQGSSVLVDVGHPDAQRRDGLMAEQNSDDERLEVLFWWFDDERVGSPNVEDDLDDYLASASVTPRKRRAWPYQPLRRARTKADADD